MGIDLNFDINIDININNDIIFGNKGLKLILFHGGGSSENTDYHPAGNF